MDIWINIGIYTTYALITICVLAILFFAINHIIHHPSQAKSVLIGIGGLLVVGVIAYLLSTGEDAHGLYADLKVTEGMSHTVGTGLAGCTL
ncbi:MAG: hypothetical protein U5L96_17275 [Owenweeksia sp.]|nr:hypothetical protein [Owenweeksia sp.]